MENPNTLNHKKENNSSLHKLILYNDEYNSFQWVMESLLEVLRIPTTTAEQLTLLAHFKGKISIKTGELEQLKLYKDALIEREINVTIES